MEHAETTVEEFVNVELVAALAWKTAHKGIKAATEKNVFICGQKNVRDGNKHMIDFLEVNQPHINFALWSNIIGIDRVWSMYSLKMEYRI